MSSSPRPEHLPAPARREHKVQRHAPSNPTSSQVCSSHQQAVCHSPENKLHFGLSHPLAAR
ncbi:hypothetical protein M407DRAFT_245006 [Tulasnella calospora MUT 4182]|uniref:Uncharacterized protein n=1 Tax=Tulasnella calospora MUT 4182 TaxID=1051891 RepID=A0A0C3QC43_9AGAM|nr:hypothetical protein M407DRAFT_245006 [Tulasnella calospora MUT 4182]